MGDTLPRISLWLCSWWECFPGRQNILQRVPEVREGININDILHINDDVSKNEEEEEYVTDGEGEQALVEC